MLLSKKKKAMTHTESIEELIKLGFSRETLDAMAPAISATRLVHYQPGDTLYHENDPVEVLHASSNGRIKLLNYLENGRARIVRLHNRSSVIGLNGLMDEPHAHTAMAIDEVSIFEIPMHLIKTIKDQDLDTYCQLLEYMNEYLNVADTWITDFSTGAIRGRVARLLRFLIETDENTGPTEVTLLTVEEMADILGVTPESVSRVMADFKRKKILLAIYGEIPDRFRCAMKGLLEECEF